MDRVDSVGQVIREGDTVAAIHVTRGVNFTKGVIVGFTPHKVRVTTPRGYRGGCELFDRVIKTEVQDGC